MNGTRRQRGLLAHSAKAAEDREQFMAMRQMRPTPVSDGEQLKYFLLYSRAGITCIFGFAAVMLFSGISG